MFIFTVKVRNHRTIRTMLIAGVVLLLLVSACVVGVINRMPDTAYCESVGEYDVAIDSDTKVEGFIEGLRLSTLELYSVKQVYIPMQFNDTYIEYNKLQQRQGLDLERYKGRRCTLYVYRLKDYTVDDSDAYISVIVYKDTVIGGHISALTQGARMYTFFGE